MAPPASVGVARRTAYLATSPSPIVPRGKVATCLAYAINDWIRGCPPSHTYHVHRPAYPGMEGAKEFWPSCGRTGLKQRPL